MTTITKIITEKLLDGTMDPDGLQTVLQKYSRNKGPLYLALAEATSIITQKLAATAEQYKEIEIKLQGQQQLIQEKEQKLHTLDQQLATQSSKLATVEEKVHNNSALLDQAKNLNGLGFGLGELEKLHHLLVDNIPIGGKPQEAIEAITIFFEFVLSYPHLSEVDSAIQEKEQKLASLDGKVQTKRALIDEIKTIGGLGLGIKELVKLRDLLVKFGASQGMPPAEIMKIFFSYIGQFQDAVVLETHIQQLRNAADTAKAETEHWRAESKAAEAKTKVRKSSIEITEKLLAHDIKERDLPHWAAILEKLGISVEELGHELDQFASLEKLCQNRQDKATKLEAMIKNLSSQVNALKDEREKVTAAITAIRDRVLAEVELTGKKTKENLDALMLESENYKNLQQEVATLSALISLAKAIKGQDPTLWSQVDTESIRVLLSDILLWCKANPSHNPDLEKPTGSFANKLSFLSLYNITLLEALIWIRKSL